MSTEAVARGGGSARVFVAAILWLAAAAGIAAAEKDVELGIAALGNSGWQARLIEKPSSTAPALELHFIGATGSPEILKLTSVGGINHKLRADEPLTALPIALPAGGSAFCLTFGVDLPSGARSVAVLAARFGAAAWSIQQEWAAESVPLGELGVSRVKQKFSSDTAGTLARAVNTFKIEGTVEKLDCGCNQCLSRTTDMHEAEVYTWNAVDKKFERAAYEKYYVVQPGEGLMAAARKALGDARLMARILRLNPDVKADQVIKEGQKLLVERKTKQP